MTKKPYRKDVHKTLMLDNLHNLAYIRQGAKLHGNERGAERWTARLHEAINIALMLQMLTDDEIESTIREAEEDCKGGR